MTYTITTNTGDYTTTTSTASYQFDYNTTSGYYDWPAVETDSSKILLNACERALVYADEDMKAVIRRLMAALDL